MFTALEEEELADGALLCWALAQDPLAAATEWPILFEIFFGMLYSSLFTLPCFPFSCIPCHTTSDNGRRPQTSSRRPLRNPLSQS